MPGDPANWVIVDEMYYFDRGPFTEAADGTGLSLHRVDDTFSGRDPRNWIAALPSPDDGGVIAPIEILQIEATTPLVRKLTWEPMPGVQYTIEAAASLSPPVWIPAVRLPPLR